MLYKLARMIARIVFKLYFRLDVEGIEHLPREGSCIFVANHVSFLDPLMICAASPRVIHYITYAFFYYHPAIHWFCKRTHCIPVKKEGNDISALKTALRLLKDGEVVGIFPEGERSANGTLSAAEPGVALIAIKANAPIVPMGIQGAYAAYPKGSFFPKPKKIRLVIGAPFHIRDHVGIERKLTEETQRQALRFIMSRIGELCGQQAPAPLELSVEHS
ncbi:phospholipid/glycerol acyltransferase [Candidatus Moduliflexus flocculans]|uniref:Phospholipid/glycerol acyltransferase n=1 Tax=Candidatus Moduliflexus flocculans TaxID=1499966 RepID=A0A081BRX7_9BACT|nr:phospholipid/glycerol acyltransferase [Candidatus Moduliflexus flocculans]